MKTRLFRKKLTNEKFSIPHRTGKGLMLLFILCMFYSNSKAQITSGFELDGNATSVIPNPPDDWDRIYNNTSSAQITTNVIPDLDNIFHGGGSKDDLNINNWGWTSSSSVPDKNNILHGGVALYNNCKLYFCADRYDTDGSSNIGFWLFKSNVSVAAGGSFSGIHTIGDLFIVSEFKDGGGTSTIKAYKWVGSGGSEGTLDEVSLNATNSFAITNSSSTASPWPYDPKSGPDNIFAKGAFFEGGIDLCGMQGLDPCFSSFLINTRSSFAVNAVLKDFMCGAFITPPQVSLTGAARCFDGPAVTLTPTVSGGITPYTYLWSPGGSTSASITVSPASTTTYTLTVSGANGCSKTVTATVTVTPKPNVNAGSDKTLSCVTPSTTLNGSSSTGGATFSWTTIGGNIVSGATTATPTVNAAGTYILTVTISAGCTAKDTVIVIFNGTPPNVNAGSDKTLSCLVSSVILNGSSSTGGATFSWSASGGGNIVSGGTTATPTVNAAGTYILTVTNPANGCTAKDTAIVILNNTKPNVNAGSDKTLTCSTTSVVLNGSSSTGGATFSWSASGGGNIVSGSTTATPTVDAAGTYILTVTNPANGCTAKDTAIVILNNTKPNVNAGADKTLNCVTASVILNGSSSTGGATFSWAASGGGNIVSGATTATPTVDAAGTYILTVTNPTNGCTAKDTAIVILNNTPPNVNAGPDQTLTCLLTETILTGSSTTLLATFSWTATNGGTILSGANTATPLVYGPGMYILTVTNPVNGCTEKDTANVFQNINLPDVNAGIDKILTCAVTSISLSGSSSTGGATFSWITIGGNIVSGATTATPTVDAAGTYILTVTNPTNGCIAIDTAMVMLDKLLPDVNAGIDKTITCTNTSVTLNGSSSTGGATYSWITIGGNIVAGGNTATPTVDAAGTYILTVTNPTNGCIAIDTAMVMLDITLPNVNAGVDTVINCYHDSIALNGSSTTLSALFNWTTNIGNIVSGATTAHAVVNTGGTYVLTITDSINGCVAMDSVDVILDITPPNADAGPDKTLTCAITQVTLDGSSITPGVIFSWVAINGGAILSGATTATPTVQIQGTYILTVTNPVNGCTAIDTVDIFQDINSPDVHAGSDTLLTCSVTSVILNGYSSTGNITYSWTTNDGNIVSGANTATPTVDAPGTYLLKVTNTITGCQACDVVVVRQDITPPNVNAGADKTLTCAVTSVILDGSSSTDGATFSWVTIGGNIVSGANTATPTVDAAGTYILTVTNPYNGCTAKDTVMIFLNNSLPDVNAGIDTVINCYNTSIALSGSSQTPHVSFSWTTGNGNIVSGANTANPVVDAAGTYVLTVTDSVNGCMAMDSVMVIMNITPPNANAGADTTLTCAATQITLNGSSTTLGATFSWTATNGGAIVSGENTATPTVQIQGTYILTVTNPVNGCTAKDTVDVFKDINAPDAHAGTDKVLTCAYTSVMLDGSSNTANVTYNWTTMNGNIVSGANTATPIVDAPGTYLLKVTNTMNGCQACDVVKVTEDITPPNVNAGLDKTLTCATTQVTLDGSSSTQGATFSWVAINGGAISSGENTATPTVLVQGTYILTVTNPVNGCTAKDTVDVFKDINTPDADAGADTTLTCNTICITLHGSSSTPNVLYCWTTLDGNIVSGANTATPKVNAPGTYVLKVINTITGCHSCDVVVVTEDITPPNVNAGADKTLTCAATSVMLDGSSSTAGATFSWVTYDGNIVSGANTATPTVDATGTYMLTVTNPATGCTATDTVMIFLNNYLPYVDAGVDAVINCYNTSISLNGSSQTPHVSFSWTTMNGNIVSGANTANPVVDAAGTYVLTVTDSVNGCMAMDSVMVIMNITPPTANAGADGILTCIVNSVMLNGSSDTEGVTFSWTTADGNIIAGANTSTPTVNAAGTYVLTVTAYSNGCTAKDSAVVLLNNTLPDVDAGADTIINCINTSIVLNGSSQNQNVSFSWTTTNGNIVSGANTANPTVNAGGTYVLTVTDYVNGCMAMDSVDVMIDINIPDVDAGHDTTLTCAVTQVVLNGSSSTPGVIFTWVASNGGVILSGANTATPLVQIPGTYILTATNPVSGCMAMDSADVFYDNSKPDVDAGVDMYLNCVTASTQLNGSSETPGATILWTALGGGNIVSDGTTFTPTVDMAGTYVLTVTHPTSLCSASDTAMVWLNISVPDVNAGADTVIGCGIDTLILYGSSSANVGYNWSTIGGHIVSGATTANPTVDAAGTYILTVIDRMSGCSASDTVVIHLSIPPVVDLGNDTAVVFCIGHITLDAGNAGATYLWSTGAMTQTIDVATTGTYYVTVTNMFGCSSSDTIHVTVNPGTVIVDLGNDTTFMNCHAPDFILDAGNPGATYVWSTTEITQTIKVTTTGTYYVTVTDTVGCMASDTINVTIINNNIDVDLGPDTSICGCILLDATHPNATYYWCGGGTYPSVNACLSGVYCVTVTNGTCTDADTVVITVNPTPIVNLGNDTLITSGTLTLNAGNAGATYLWSNGDTTQTTVITESGLYYVTVTNVFGCSASDTILIIVPPNGINEHAVAGFNMNIYPNPSITNTFTLSFEMTEKTDVEVRIVNLLGEAVYSEKLKNFSGTYQKVITLKDATQGVYFTEILSGNKRSTAKLILE